jgi:ubiquinone/menaquinone biosynthesis C-methylase UbiE
MAMQLGLDRKVLREQEYADDSHLEVRRRTHHLYTLSPVDFGRWTLERLPWRGGERVLDVGCGPSDLLGEMARHRVARHHQSWGILVGFDFSDGMIAKATRTAAGLPVHFFVGDVQAIPLSDETFDVVMARHMLYHVPDIDRAVAEAVRVLRPGGSLLATTNRARNMPEYEAILGRAAARFPSVAEPARITDRFSLENAVSFLEPYLDQIETHILPGTLRFPTSQPFLDYFASARAMTMHPDQTKEEWLAVLDFVRAETEAIISHQGYFDVTKTTGAIVGIRRS